MSGKNNATLLKATQNEPKMDNSAQNSLGVVNMWKSDENEKQEAAEICQEPEN